MMEKSVLSGFSDFSFQTLVTPRILKFLCGLHLFAGLVAAVAISVNGFYISPVQGLLLVLVSVLGLLLWIIYLRVALEVLAAVFRGVESLGTIAETVKRG